MKYIFFMLFILFPYFSFTQKIIIHIFEKQEMGCYRKTSLDSVFINSDFIYDIDSTHTTYILELSEKNSKYISNGVKISELPIEYEYYGSNILRIKIKEDDFDYGLIINTEEESVLWYWFTEYQTTAKRITKCYFEKPS